MKKEIIKLGTFFILGLAVYGCKRINKNNTDNDSKPLIDSQKIGIYSAIDRIDDVGKLIGNAVWDGDTMAYQEVGYAYQLDSKLHEILYYSLVVSNDYDNALASFHVYKVLHDSNIHRKGKINYRTEMLSKYYLLRAKELGYKKEYIGFILEECFGKNKKIPTSKQLLIEWAKMEE